MPLHLPEEFERNMKDRLGPRFTDFYTSLAEVSPVSIRHNPRKSAKAINHGIPWCKTGEYMDKRPVFTLDPGFHAGAYYVQEASSMFLEQAIRQSVDLGKELIVLDLCAAPGGKSTHILSQLSEQSLLISNEIIRSRIGVLSENIQKWGHDDVIVTQSDPADFQRLPSFFDLIVVDAPCSGEGLFRKDADAMQEWSEQNVELCALRQRRIIKDVWPALKTGGVMIYSTCTYSEKENIENLSWLNSQEDIESIRLSPPSEWGIDTIENGSLVGYQFFPHRVRGEGFYLTAFRKLGTGERTGRPRDTLVIPNRNRVKDFSNWVLKAESKLFFQHHETVHMMPQARQTELQLALNKINVVQAGTAILEITKNKLVPDHAFALSVNLNKEQFNILRLSREIALQYLSKNTLQIPETQPGFALIEYEGLGLGWVNVLQNRINNLYPATWRIRMGH